MAGRRERERLDAAAHRHLDRLRGVAAGRVAGHPEAELVAAGSQVEALADRARRIAVQVDRVAAGGLRPIAADQVDGTVGDRPGADRAVGEDRGEGAGARAFGEGAVRDEGGRVGTARQGENQGASGAGLEIEHGEYLLLEQLEQIVSKADASLCWRAVDDQPMCEIVRRIEVSGVTIELKQATKRPIGLETGALARSTEGRPRGRPFVLPE